MKNISFILLLAAIYFAGIYTGLSIQAVNALVKVPGAYNQPVVSGNSKTSNQAPAQPAKKIIPQRNNSAASNRAAAPTKVISSPTTSNQAIVPTKSPNINAPTKATTTLPANTQTTESISPQKINPTVKVLSTQAVKAPSPNYAKPTTTMVPSDISKTAGTPISPPSATSQGATLYSLSSSMQVDIQRLEMDVAALKNKVNILSNMR